MKGSEKQHVLVPLVCVRNDNALGIQRACVAVRLHQIGTNFDKHSCLMERTLLLKHSKRIFELGAQNGAA